LLKSLLFARGATIEKIGGAIAFLAFGHSGYTSGLVFTNPLECLRESPFCEGEKRQMPHLTTDDGVKLYYEETGKGIPIVFYS